MPRPMSKPGKPNNPFRYFNSSPEVIRPVAMMCARFLLSLRDVKDLLYERGIDICRGARPCGCGGTGLARCSLPITGGNG